MSLEESQEKFLDIIRSLESEKEKIHFLKWINIHWNLDQLKEDDKDDRSKHLLNVIAEDLRNLMPFSSILPSENINVPVCGPNSDCDPDTTLYVDEFLYDDDYIDELVEAGKFSRHYCQNCLSRNIKPLTFVSHSVSVDRIHFIFKYLLHPLKNEIILDVGSRLGPVLYGAYLFTQSPKIIGVEMNSDLANMQSDIVKKYKFDDRIKIICNNICNEVELLSSVDVIFLNNVFEFFADYKTAIASWHVLMQNIKPGCILVTIPHLEDTFKHFEVDFQWENWVDELEPHGQDLILDEEKLENHLMCVKRYVVKKKFNATDGKS